MKIKRIISCIISLMLVFTLFAKASEMYTQDEVATYINDIGFLKTIDVADFDDNITKTVTRGEFSKILAVMSGTAPYSGESEFVDVGSDNIYASYINAVSDRGFLRGYGNNTFGPEDTLTYYQAIAGFVRILGYGQVVENTYEAYQKQASELGLLKKTYGNSQYPITAGSLANMIVNTLNADTLRIADNGKDLIKGEKLLKSVFDLTKQSGIVTADSKTSLNTPEGAGENRIGIDNEVYEYEGSVSELVGYSIDYYIDDDGKVVYFCKKVKENDELVINAKDIEGYLNREYTYAVSSSRTKTVEIPIGCSVIYNGKAITGEADIDMKIKNGELVFLDNDDNGKYDVLKITDIKTMVVGIVDKEEYIVYDKFKHGETISLKEAYNENSLVVKNYQGVDIGVDKISDGNVISVIRSMDGKLASVEVSNTKISGTIEMYSLSNLTVKVDATEYEVLEDNFNFDVNVGSNGTLYVDVYGNAVYFDKASDGLRYGYLTDEPFLSDDGSTYGMKIFDFETGDFKVAYLRNSIKVDGISYKNAQNAIDFLKNSSQTVEPQIIGWMLNSDGEIIVIDSLNHPPTEEKDRLRKFTEATEKEWRSAQMCFRDGKTYTTGSTVFVKIPENPVNAKSEEYRIIGQNELSTDYKYSFTSYQTTDTNYSADYILITNYDGEQFGIVSDVKAAYINGETVYSVDVYPETGSMVTLYTQDENGVSNLPGYDTSLTVMTGDYELKAGDVIKYCTKVQNNQNIIYNIEVILDIEEGYAANANPINSNWAVNGINWFAGSVYSKEGSILAMTKEELTETDPMYTADELILEAFTRGTVYKAEKVREKIQVQKASMSDVVDYKNVGTGCSKVLVLNRSLTPRFMYIYE